MTNGYQIKDLEALYYLTFQVAGWIGFNIGSGNINNKMENCLEIIGPRPQIKRRSGTLRLAQG